MSSFGHINELLHSRIPLIMEACITPVQNSSISWKPLEKNQKILKWQLLSHRANPRMNLEMRFGERFPFRTPTFIRECDRNENSQGTLIEREASCIPAVSGHLHTLRRSSLPTDQDKIWKSMIPGIPFQAEANEFVSLYSQIQSWKIGWYERS